jgi:hypothetical protein
MSASEPAPEPAPAAAIPAICDRCRAAGRIGEDPFTGFGDLLDFAPVPRRSRRANGWDEEAQRAFIAALALTGSVRAAARAVGRADFGVKQLLDCPGSAGFRAAMEEARSIAADERSRRLAEGLRAVAADQSGWRPPDPPWAGAASRSPAAAPAPRHGGRRRPLYARDLPPEEQKAREQAAKEKSLDAILNLHMLKLREERDARVAGRIIEADFYLRQITILEVLLDTLHHDAIQLLTRFRRDGHLLFDIAETPFSRALLEARIAHWEACGDPPRPRPPRHLLREKPDGLAIAPCHSLSGPDKDAEQRRREEQCRRDAEAQVRWEAEARRDYEARRAASQPIGEASAEDLPQAGREANEASAGRRALPDETGATRPTSRAEPPKVPAMRSIDGKAAEGSLP